MDALIRGLAWLALRLFYRGIELRGAENLPARGPVIVVANHFNSLVDGILMTAYLPRMPRFIAASTVWDHGPVRPFLAAAGVVPVYRQQDGQGDRAAMAQTFRTAVDLLGAGGVLAIFPEGRSHNAPAVLPLKSGTARIALLAQGDLGDTPVQIVPVSLGFDDKNRFRSRAVIEVGPAMTVSDTTRDEFAQGSAGTRADAVRAMNQQIDGALTALAPRYETWADVRLIDHCVSLLPPLDPALVPGPPGLGQQMARRRIFFAGFLELRDQMPGRIETLRRDLERYDAALTRLGLGTHGADGPPKLAGLLPKLAVVLAALPLGLVGLVMHGPVYWLLWTLSRRQDLDKRSTWSIFAGMIVFPLFWAVLAAVTALALGRGPATALAIFAAGPLTGLAMPWYLDTWRDLRHGLRGAWLWWRRPTLMRDLHSQQDSIRAQVRALADLRAA